jgi:hypothetical protein
MQATLIKKAGPLLTLPVKMFLNYLDVLGFNLLSSPLLRSFPDLRSRKSGLYGN